MQKNRFIHCLYLIIILLVISCGAYVLDSAQYNLRTSFASGDYDKTVELLNNFESSEVYEQKDAVLLDLEMGTAHHFARNYAQSNQNFESAEYEIEDLYTKSVSRAIKSFLVNDTILAYDGEDYEDIYLNAFKALNYIHLGDLDAALIESRRISYKLSQLNIKYKDIVTALSEADTTKVDTDKWKTGETNIQNSSMGHFLSTILYSKTGKQDDARIAYNNLLTAYQDQPKTKSDHFPNSRELQTLLNPNSYNVLIKAFTGRSPAKNQNDLRIYFEEIDTYLKYSLPVLQLYNSSVTSIRVSVNGEEIINDLNMIEHLDLVAKEVYKVKEPIIYARTIVRASLKAAATNKASNEINEQNELLGRAVRLLGKVAQEATEKADLRSWQTMPGKSYGTVLKLPEGTHTIELEYYESSGRLLFTDTQEIKVGTEKDLTLVESIYWN